MPKCNTLALVALVFLCQYANGQTYNFTNGTSLTTCSGDFFDSGGSGGNYNWTMSSMTITSNDPAKNLRVQFSTWAFASGDYLEIFSGNSTTSANLIGVLSGSGSNRAFTSSALGGTLTFRFYSYDYGSAAGWAATIGCCDAADAGTAAISAPTNVTANTAFSLTMNGTFCGALTWQSSVDGSTWTDIGSQNSQSTTLDRSKFFRGKFTIGASVAYSPQVLVTVNNVQMSGAVQTVYTCNSTFYDLGGSAGNYGSWQNTVIIFPDDATKKAKVHFSSFALAANDRLDIYNGNSTAPANLIGSLSGSGSNRTFCSSDATGALRLVFYWDDYGSAAGWAATIGCCDAASSAGVTVASSAATICAGQNFVLTASGNSCGSLIWQSSADGTTFSDLAGKINPQQTLTQNAELFYRAKYTVGATTAFSNSVFVGINCFNMGQASAVTDCSLQFFDSGGENGNYSWYQNQTVTFYPATAGAKVKLDFTTFNTEANIDILQVFNGNSVSAASLGTMSGSISQRTFCSSAADGSLTFRFQSDDGTELSGWKSTLSCCTTAASSTVASSAAAVCAGQNFNLFTTGTFCGGITWQSSTDGATWSDLPALAGPFVTTSISGERYFRAKFTLGATEAFSTPILVSVNCVNMGQTTAASVCDANFYDSGGAAGNYSWYANQTLTLTPPTAGKLVRVKFTAFSTESCCDQLQIFNGNTVAAPLFATLNGTALPATTFCSGAADGSLTFRFQSDDSNESAGWAAQITCCDAPGAGNFAITDTAVCAGENFALQMTGDYCGILQWQFSHDGSAWSNLSGGTVPNFTTNATQTTFYRARLVVGTDTIFTANKTVSIDCVRLGLASTARVCGVPFYDNGGAAGNYSDYSNQTVTVFPATQGANVEVSFSSFSTESCCDVLRIYDGTSTAGTLLATYQGTPTTGSFRAKNVQGALTFQFQSDDSGVAPGFVGTLGCCSTVQAGTLTASHATRFAGETVGLTVSGDYCGYFGWMASTDNQNFTLIGTDETNGSLTLNHAPTRSTWYKAAFILQGDTAWSNTVFVEINGVKMGAVPEATVCGGTFWDNGGAAGNYSPSLNQTLTLRPASATDMVQLTFTAFNIEQCCDTLIIYDGATTAAAILGKYNGTSLPPVVAPTNSEGVLTFRFKSDGSEQRAGWAATVACVPNVNIREVVLPLTVLLEGAWENSTSRLKDRLRTTGVLPTANGFSGISGFSAVGDTTTYAMPTALLSENSADAAICDWIWVELRNENDSTKVLFSRPALLRRDGQVKDVDGVSDMIFPAQPGNYFVAVRHRNHLGSMTAAPVSVQVSGTARVDFSDQNMACFGTNARKISGGRAFLWAGDANGDGQIVASGGSTDANPITSAVLLAPENSGASPTFQLNGYNRRDLNLDGKTVFSGAASEVNIITSNVLTHPANGSGSATFKVVEQLPR